VEKRLTLLILVLIFTISSGFSYASAPLSTGVPNGIRENSLFYNIVRNEVITNQNAGMIQSYPIIFNESEKFNVGIKIVNNNNQSASYEINSISVHDIEKLNPNTERWNIQQRIEPSKVDFCTLEFPTSTDSIPANSEKTINVGISCSNMSCIERNYPEQSCQFVLIPNITYQFSNQNKNQIGYSGGYFNSDSFDMFVENFIIRTNKPSESNKIGDACTTSSDCTLGSCLYCPSDTQFKIQLDSDPYAISNCKYMKQQYGDSVQCQSEPNIVTLNGGSEGYCALDAIGARSCQGSWNGDVYFIRPSYGTKDTTINKELTHDVLDKWKALVLRNISESYFDTHIVVDEINPQIENDILGAGITYKFKYDWAQTNNTDREVIYVKRSVNGNWVWLSDNEIASRFDQERAQQHNFVDSYGNIGYTKPTEYEISSIISEAQALASIKTCDNAMTIRDIDISSVNNTIVFTASGIVNRDTQNCETNKDATYTVTTGTVNLVTNQVSCNTAQSACVVYAASKSDTSNSPSGTNIVYYLIIPIIFVVGLVYLYKRNR
jgi:hypothetical protein